MPTRTEIIKALRCDGISEGECGGCSYGESFCIPKCMIDAADLIEQQVEEIEQLKLEHDAVIKDLAAANECEISKAFRWRRVGGRG